MNSVRKLLRHEKVEVRQLEEGLRGSWHSGQVVGISESCRDVMYDELLCESGSSKLVESIPVTGAIEGLYQRPCVKSNYRGRIRPIPPDSESCSVNSRLKFGVCVDVLYKEAWWEGVIFDCDEDSKERRVFFPDESDERTYKNSDIRVTLEWDEYSGSWRERGVWLLVNLAREHKKEGHLFQLIRRVWSRLKIHYGFQKMISEWTCGAYSVWKDYFREVLGEIASKPRMESLLFSSSSHRHMWKKRGRRLKRGSNLNGSVLTRSMQKRKEKEVSLAVRTRRMCLSEPDNSPLSAITKGSQLTECQCRNIEVHGAGEKLGYDQAPSMSCVDSSDEFAEKRAFHLANTRCLENCFKVPLKSRLRRKWQLRVENSLTPTKLKPSKIKGQELMPTQKTVSFDLRYPALRQGGRRRFPRRGIKKKRSPVRVKRVSSRIWGKDIGKSNSLLSRELETSPPLQNEDDVVGSHCEDTLHATVTCQETEPEDTMSSPHKQRGKRSRSRDSVCFVCQYGDDLLHCDDCMSSYHLTCVNLEDVTTEESCCPSCSCGLCGFIDRANDDQQFTEVCYQCTRQYHVACLDKSRISFSEDTFFDKFCSGSCFEICARLHQLLRISNPTSVEGLSWTITRSRRNDCNVYNERIHPLIQVSQVLNVFKECFQPITEPHTGRDLVADIVYNSGSKFRRLDFHGFYVMALVNSEEPVCVATIRIHGQKVAEMPLIATPFKHRRKGMCRLLLLELEKMLVEMGVERLVLPGIASLSNTWVSSFGFTEMPASLRRELLGYPFVVFQGTTMFQKILSRRDEGYTGSLNHRRIEASRPGIDSSGGCRTQLVDSMRKALRPITRTYCRRRKRNRELDNLESRINYEGSMEASTKLDCAQLELSKENCSNNEPKRFNLCYKRRKSDASCKAKTTMDGFDRNQPTYKNVYKRRRIQASRDPSDCL